MRRLMDRLRTAIESGAYELAAAELLATSY